MLCDYLTGTKIQTQFCEEADVWTTSPPCSPLYFHRLQQTRYRLMNQRKTNKNHTDILKIHEDASKYIRYTVTVPHIRLFYAPQTTVCFSRPGNFFLCLHERTIPMWMRAYRFRKCYNEPQQLSCLFSSDHDQVKSHVYMKLAMPSYALYNYGHTLDYWLTTEFSVLPEFDHKLERARKVAWISLVRSVWSLAFGLYGPNKFGGECVKSMG